MKSLSKDLIMPLAGTLGFLFAFTMPVSTAHAQDVDPFQTGPGVWKSFDRYKEEQKNRLFSESTGNLEADTKAAAVREAVEEDQSETETQSITAKDKKSEAATASAPQAADGTTGLAPPERPLALPSMPALSARFNVAVDTTEDDTKPSAHIAHIDSDPDLQLPKQNWLSAAQAAQLIAQGKDKTSENTPINVRLTFLPNFKAPVQHKAAAVAVAAMKLPPAPEPATDHAACAAIDAYKKRELEAIQSDRNTLTALQAAISELGLKKQLNFVAGVSSKIDTPDDNSATKSASP